MRIEIAHSFQAVNPTEWNRLVEPTNPFMRHEFFDALEKTGCIGAGTSWEPTLFLAYEEATLVGAIPAFRRWDSFGEYIFDWSWAQAYANAGIEYYPKLTVAAPFTPATGRRFLCAEPGQNVITITLANAAVDFARSEGLSGVHVLCETQAEQTALAGLSFMPRITHQYHWVNSGFDTFADYLARLRSHRRKDILRERRKVNELGLDIVTLTGGGIREKHMLAMYRFYIQTYERKWGEPYLNCDTFLALWRSMPECLVLTMAFEGPEPVAGALAFRSADHLYGRYWGAKRQYPFLHFELCLYRLIEHAIEEKISLFEAGAQGEHKFQRGFDARPVYSSHVLFNPDAARAIAHFLDNERAATERFLEESRLASPIK